MITMVRDWKILIARLIFMLSSFTNAFFEIFTTKSFTIIYT